MGREISYFIKNKAPFSRFEIGQLEAVIQGFHAFFDWPNDFFNIEHFLAVSPNSFDARVSALKEEGFSAPRAWDTARNEGLATIHGGRGTVSGVSTPGDDGAAFFLMAGLVEISRRIPHLEIEIRDDGELLRCPLLLRNGAARPDIAAIRVTLSRHLATFTSVFWRPLLGDRLKNHLLSTLLPPANECSLWARVVLDDDLRDIDEWLPAYQQLWDTQCGETISFLAAREFWVGAGVFIRAHLISIETVNHYFGKAGLPPISMPATHSIIEQGEYLDQMVDQLIRAGVPTS